MAEGGARGGKHLQMCCPVVDISHAGGKRISALLNIIYSEVIACPHVHVQWIKRHCHNVRRHQTEESVVAKNDQKMCDLINLGRETHVK